MADFGLLGRVIKAIMANPRSYSPARIRKELQRIKLNLSNANLAGIQLSCVNLSGQGIRAPTWEA
ncbi:MAG: hypothetical protein KGH72_04095 [Candidatus Micrarchaeota archaeon]|nr:hypothetical protein [Candidatus Micrarchaeota archaeon]